MKYDFKKDLQESLACKRIEFSHILPSLERKKVYLVGKNADSINVSKYIDVEGIIDDFNSGELWNGFKLYSMEEVDKSSLIINCVTSISPITVSERLVNQGFSDIITLSDLIDSNNYEIDEPWFVKEAKNSYNNRLKEWDDLYNRLEDKMSRDTMIDLLSFRITSNINFMKGYSVRLREQYLESFMSYTKEYFVDAGGYDGDTTRLFCDKYEDYAQVYLFEPSPINLKKAKHNLRQYDRINYYELGLSNKSDRLSFDTSSGSASSISDSADFTIDTVTLDEQINGNVSFIKMDIEGWELKALQGSKSHIKNNSPKLAIAVYHNINDFLDVPKYINKINPNYKIYLRHYTEGWSETIMYFKL